MKPVAKILSIFSIIVMLAFLLPGCSKIAATSSPGTALPFTPGSGTSVTPQLDTANLVDALIPEKGGQVTLTLPNGIAFKLTIPEGALLNDQEITLTPITRIDGMLLSGGLIAGVELQPEGLVLDKPATLTITVPRGYDVKQMVGIGYHSKGTGFHLDLATGDGKTITMQIDSFSGHGAASGTKGDISNQAGQPASSPADKTAQQTADAVQKCVGQDVANCLPLIQQFIDTYKNQIKPDLQAAQSDDTLIDSAGAEFLKWWHDVEWLNLDEQITINGTIYNLPGYINEGKKLFAKGLRNAFDQASKRCISQEDISQVTKMYNRLRVLALLADDSTPPYTLQTKWKDFEACSRYRLTFESNMTWKMGDSMVISADLKGSAIFRLDEEGMYIVYSTRNAPGTLTYQSFDINFNGASQQLSSLCTIDTSEVSGKLIGALRLAHVDQASGNSVVDPLPVLKPTAFGQNVPKWVCKTGAAKIDVSSMLPELPLWESGFFDLHKFLRMGDFVGKDYTVTDPYWFTQTFTGGDGVYHLGSFKLHDTANSSGANCEEDLTITIDAAPGATK